MRYAFWFALVIALPGCGGKVVFQEGEPEGGAGGAGGGDPLECFAGCGEPCTKCVGTECFSGWCSDDGLCMPPESPTSCIAG